MSAKDEPAEIEVWRGDMVESRHRAHIAVVDAHGRVIFARGDIEKPIYGRSAIKPLLAIALVESGAADRFGLGDREIALATASHNGEAGHVAAVKDWLARIGLGVEHLECGSQAPSYEPALRDMYAKGEVPSPAHNNCSGKHSGFLTTARHLGEATAGYIRFEHSVQQRLLGLLEQMAGLDLSHVARGIDGCGIPVIAFPIGHHALAMAQMADPHHLPDRRAAASRRILAAMAAEPWYVAGTDRFCTRLMQVLGGKAAVKVGAEGVYMAALPELGLGLCLKIEDGASRAAEVALGQVLRDLGVIAEADLAALGEALIPPIKNWVGTVTGKITPAPDFATDR